MNTNRPYRRVAQFHVLYKTATINGRPVADRWRDYFGRKLTFVAASEEMDKLMVQYPTYQFQVAHKNHWERIQQQQKEVAA